MKTSKTTTARISLEDLAEILDVYPAPSEFVESCREAAEVGWKLRFMREAREQNDAAADGSSFVSYLKHLSGLAGLNTSAWRSLTDWYCAGSIGAVLRHAERVSKLTKALGMPRVEIVARVRLGLAELTGDYTPALARAVRGGSEPRRLQESVQAIAHIQLDANAERNLRRFEKEMKLAYEE